MAVVKMMVAFLGMVAVAHALPPQEQQALLAKPAGQNQKEGGSIRERRTVWTGKNPGPSYSQVGVGLCWSMNDQGGHDYGIRVYEGNGDTPGTADERLARCASGCFNQITPREFGPWIDQGPALGFGMNSQGRCYCHHIPHSTCQTEITSYVAYEFNSECNSEGFVLQTTGTCPIGTSFIESDSDCANAAVSLGLSQTSVTDTSWNGGRAHNPHGCFFINRDSNPILLRNPKGDMDSARTDYVSLCRCQDPLCFSGAGYIDASKRTSGTYAKWHADSRNHCMKTCDESVSSKYYSYFNQDGLNCKCARADSSADNIAGKNPQVSEEPCDGTGWCTYAICATDVPVLLGQNWATASNGGTASQFPNCSYSPAKAIDGVLNNFHHTCTTQAALDAAIAVGRENAGVTIVGSQPWLKVEFETEVSVTKIKIMNRIGSDASAKRLTDFTLRVLDETGSTVWEKEVTDPGASSGEVTEYSIASGTPLIPPLMKGGSGCTNTMPCGACEGDCDNDSQCLGDFKCHNRVNEDGSEGVPGCFNGDGGLFFNYDYCYDPNRQTTVNSVHGRAVKLLQRTTAFNGGEGEWEPLNIAEVEVYGSNVSGAKSLYTGVSTPSLGPGTKLVIDGTPVDVLKLDLGSNVWIIGWVYETSTAGNDWLNMFKVRIEPEGEGGSSMPTILGHSKRASWHQYASTSTFRDELPPLPSFATCTVQATFVEACWGPIHSKTWYYSSLAFQLDFVLQTSQPSAMASAMPSTKPSAEPSVGPTGNPSAMPIVMPSTMPTVDPSANPTSQPSAMPTAMPSTKPTAEPSVGPTGNPSAIPSAIPTANPSAIPSATPTSNPTSLPSSQGDALQGVLQMLYELVSDVKKQNVELKVQNVELKAQNSEITKQLTEVMDQNRNITLKLDARTEAKNVCYNRRPQQPSV